MLQGVPGFVGAYDLQSGCRIGRIDIRATAIELKFSSDGSLLVVATAVRHAPRLQAVHWCCTA
jgi:hypothetical protein